MERGISRRNLKSFNTFFTGTVIDFMRKKYFTMKKFLLFSAVAFSFFAANAQTKKSSKKSKKPTKEAIAKANFTKKEEVKKMARTAMIDSLRMTDSVRIMNDSLADVQKEADRVAYKQAGMMAIDSTNKESYKMLNKERSSWETTAKSQADISKAAGLSEYETKQVKAINEQYNDKAKELIQGGDPQAKKQELIALNEQRRAKIATITGKGKERRLEKERKDYMKKNSADTDSQWVDLAEQSAK